MIRRSREWEAARREAESALLTGHGPKGVSHEQQEHGPGGERPDGACGASRDSDEHSRGPLAEPVHHQPHSRLFFDPYVQRAAWPVLGRGAPRQAGDLRVRLCRAQREPDQMSKGYFRVSSAGRNLDRASPIRKARFLPKLVHLPLRLRTTVVEAMIQLIHFTLGAQN